VCRALAEGERKKEGKGIGIAIKIRTLPQTLTSASGHRGGGFKPELAGEKGIEGGE